MELNNLINRLTSGSTLGVKEKQEVRGSRKTLYKQTKTNVNIQF